MSDDPVTYLLDRFATDATTLRARADMLAGQPAPPHGPDAAASRAMADACEEVITLLHGVESDSEDTLLESLEALGPELHALAERAKSDFVRSVYAGAATRITEIVRRTRGDESD
jgi:hypothetical protein